MKNIFTICVAIVIFSVVLFGCGQGSSKQKELELKEKELLLKEKELQLKEDSIKEVNKNEKPSYAKTEIENKITTKSDIEEKCIILNTWLKYAIGYNSGININTFIKANFNSVQNYKNSISSSFKEKINFRVNGIKPEIEVSNKSIILTFTLENQGYEKFIILEDKFIFTYHITPGSSKRCVLYDLLTQREKEYPFNIHSVQNNIAAISQDDYDNEGHFWQNGKLNLSTGSTTWDSKQH